MKNNKGVTLIEILVTLVITAIVMLVLGNIYLSTTGYYTYFSSKREAEIILNTVFDEMEERITFATDIFLSYDSAAKENCDAICISKEEGSINPVLPGGRIFEYRKDTNADDTYEDMYGDVFYDSGLLKCFITNTSATTLHVKLQYLDSNAEVLYERERNFNVINMSGDAKTSTIKVSSGNLNETYDNSSKNIYLYLEQTEKIIQPSPLGNELKIWEGMQRIFADNTKTQGDYYSNYVLDAKIPVRNKFAVLAYEYVKQNGEGNFTWPMITSETLEQWGLNGRLPAYTYYMIPYHYIANEKECDVLYFGYADDYYDPIGDTMRQTRLIFLQEENAWYYFEMNDSLAKDQCKSLELWDENAGEYKSTNAVPVEEGSKIRYSDASGEIFETTIQSSYQIKSFFKLYGHLAAQKTEQTR